MEILFILVGLPFIAFGVFWLFNTYKFRQVSKLVSGQLIGYETHLSRSKNNRNTTIYAPVIEFKSRGETYCFKATISSSHKPYDFGAKVPVLYMANNPHDARIRTNTRYVLAGIMTFLGGVLTIVGVSTYELNWFSLIISLIVITHLSYKAIQFKGKLNQKGIYTLADFKASTKARNQSDGQSIQDNISDSLTGEEQGRNYIPSESMLTGQQSSDRKLILKQQQSIKWMSAVTLVVAFAMLIGGGYWGKTRYDFISSASSTIGTIVSMSSSRSDGTTVYAPIVEYIHSQEGQTVQFKDQASTSHPSWRVGDKVTVLYDPTEQDNAMLDDGWFNWFGPGLIFVMGFFFLLFGMLTRTKVKRV